MVRYDIIYNFLHLTHYLLGVSKNTVDEFFDRSVKEIYSGYCDDPRNTDNAWIETYACNFHDEHDSEVEMFQFIAGSDAKNVKWLNVDHNCPIHSTHKLIIQNLTKQMNAHW